MKRLSMLLAWLATAVVAGLAMLNWSTLMALSTLNLVVTEVQVPLGAAILVLTAVLAGLFFVAYLQQQIGSLLESRRMLKEVHRAHDLADKAEASRVESLRELIGSEFRNLNQRLSSGVTVLPSGRTAEASSAASIADITPRRASM